MVGIYKYKGMVVEGTYKKMEVAEIIILVVVETC